MSSPGNQQERRDQDDQQKILPIIGLLQLLGNDPEEAPNRLGALLDMVKTGDGGITTDQVQKVADLMVDDGQTRLWRRAVIVPAENDDRAHGDTSKIPSHMHYAKLRRKLPSTARPNDEIFSKDKSDHAKILVDKLYKDEFALEWSQDETTLVLRVIMDDDLRARLQDESGDAYLFHFRHYQVPTIDAGKMFNGADVPSHLLRSLFPRNKRDVLVRRVLHRFYRKHASELLPFHRETLFHMLRSRYRMQERYSGLVDISIAFVDACFMQDCEKVLIKMACVGEALEAKGKFYDAALVYEDIILAKKEEGSKMDEDSVRSVFQSYAGIAYHRAGELEAAERHFVTALWLEANQPGTTSSNWDVNSKGTYNRLFEIMKLMEDPLIKHGFEATDLARCWPPFIGILHAADFDFSDSEGIVPRLYDMNPRFACERLKSKFVGSKTKAIKAIRDLVPPKRSPPTVTEFRSKLLSYVKPNLRGTSFAESIIDDIDDFRQNQIKNKGKVDARETVAKDTKDIFTNALCCNNLLCSETQSLRTCTACQNAKYCSKECQRAHWSFHKHFCTFTTSKKKHQEK